MTDEERHELEERLLNASVVLESLSVLSAVFQEGSEFESALDLTDTVLKKVIGSLYDIRQGIRHEREKRPYQQAIIHSHSS